MALGKTSETAKRITFGRQGEAHIYDLLRLIDREITCNFSNKSFA